MHLPDWQFLSSLWIQCQCTSLDNTTQQHFFTGMFIHVDAVEMIPWSCWLYTGLFCTSIVKYPQTYAVRPAWRWQKAGDNKNPYELWSVSRWLHPSDTFGSPKINVNHDSSIYSNGKSQSKKTFIDKHWYFSRDKASSLINEVIIYIHFCTLLVVSKEKSIYHSQ